MASKPETTFYTSVHKHLPPESQLHREKMANPYRGGTFDHWYSGRRDLWIEWKFLVLPKRDDTIIDLCTPRGKKMESPLSALQQDWGQRRFEEGRSVWVGVGCKEGGLFLRSPFAWRTPFPTADFKNLLKARKEMAYQIEEFLALLP